jgi:RNA-binding protein
MLTSKQRAQLRAIANREDTIVYIGKGGITENIVKQAQDALKAREIIKCRVLENSILSSREACDRLSELTQSEQVQVIGSRFVLYKRNPEDAKIELVK